MSTAVLLGPQRQRPTVAAVVDLLEISGPLAVVTAGWEEREDQDAELRDHLGGRTVNLHLYRRSEEAFAADPELAAAWHGRQERLRELQVLYRVRLAHGLAAARELVDRPAAGEEPSPRLREQQDQAIAAVRDLDERHLEAVALIHQEFEAETTPWERPAVARHRSELGEILGRCGALGIAGGHVVVLLNRLRLFGLLGPNGLTTEVDRDLPILAWSAGAMALAERIVLFHDSPPQGAGNAEVLEVGIGAYLRILPFPHARRRLRLDDPARVALLAQRMAPRRCVLLDDGDQLFWNGSFWSSPDGARWLEEDGGVGAGSDGLP
jgi:hypothetical protein